MMPPNVLRIIPSHPDQKIIEEASRVIQRGGVIIYPTDTVYGLGATIDNKQAISRIYELKGRERKPLPIITSSLKRAMEIAAFNSKAKTLAREFWPGPLTIKVYARRELLPEFLDEKGRLAIRVPDHEIAIKLAEKSGGYIVGTSANKSGSPSPVTAEEALREMDDVDLVIDAGPTIYRTPSTIIDVTVNPPEIIRVGALAPEDIERVLEEKINILSL